jgi:hypothetical protein
LQTQKVINMKITMHRIIIVVGLFLIATNINAQPELKISRLKLTGDIARIYSSAIGAEVGYFFDFSDRIKFGATIGYFSSHPTKSSYPSYSIGSDQVTGGGDITFFPAEISYENLSIFPVGLNSFYRNYSGCLKGYFAKKSYFLG